MRLPRAVLPLLLVVPLAACAIAPARAHASRIGVVRDLRVPTIGDASVTIDVWKQRGARSARQRPVALLVHGGGWHTGDKRQWEQSRWAQRLAARGWIVVNANYRLACRAEGSEPEPAATAATPETAAATPETAAARLARAGARDTRTRDPRLCGHAMRTSIADVRATLRYTASRARNWGGDPARIVLFGASAGAQLAMLAGSAQDRPAGVRAVVAISPPTDLAWVGARAELPLHPSAALSIGCLLDACADAWHRASPVRHVRRGKTPPTWLFDAGADPITPIGPVRAYAARLRAAGIAAAMVTTADPEAQCHGPMPCAAAPLRGSPLDLFEHAQSWLRPRLR